MRQRAAQFLNGIGGATNGLLARQGTRAGLIACLALTLGLSAVLVGSTLFSPDSWAYFELSQTVFTDHFYRFNTWRSYLTDAYSASFPLGYPVALALLERLVGPQPLTAVALNIGVAVATAPVLFQICRQLEIPPLASVAVVTALLSYREYVEEVLTGRSIPLALLLCLAGCLCVLRRRALWAGLLLGLAAVVRFDFLAHSLLLLFAGWAFAPRPFNRGLLLLAGFAVGLSPWVVFSWTHFGIPWATDNSWVALSAGPAWVLDYPPVASETVFQNPSSWFARVVHNVVPLCVALAQGCAHHPLVASVLVLVAFSWNQLRKQIDLRVAGLGAVLAASFIPYLLTGYFDLRYFSLAFSGASVLGLHLASRAAVRVAGLDLAGFSAPVLLLTVAVGGAHGALLVSAGHAQVGEMARQRLLVDALRNCHQGTPERTYVFTKGAMYLAPKYGALTGMRAAFIPANFDRLTAEGRAAYWGHIGPNKVIDSLRDVPPCPDAEGGSPGS